MKELESLAERWPALSPLLDEALALPAAERSAWLGALPAEAEGLRDTLRSLLASNARIETGDFLGTLPKFAPGAAGSDHSPDARMGDLVGPYRLVSLLGRGGMGDVWLAERADGELKRQVALKLPRVMWGGGLVERLLRERDILAQLAHPNIARLYDAGVDAQGRPFLALEFVQGSPIDQYCRERDVSIKTRLQLLLQVAAAVAHAHARLVVHRDLKPANVIVTDAGEVRLLDFGIAKLIEGDGAVETRLTQLSGRAMTLDYASPEQIRGEALGTASDVYSLGVLAYELLTGAKPYRLKRGSTAELEEAIANVEPALPSAASVQQSVRKALRGDLDAILNRALKKRAADRYPSVESMAQDIERHLRGEPVLARPDTLSYRGLRFVMRHRLPVAAGAVAVAALFAGTTVAWLQALRADAERTSAVLANQRAVVSQAAAESEAAAAREQRSAALAAQARAESAAEAERLAAAEATRHAKRAVQAGLEAQRASRRAELAATREREQAGLARSEADRARAVRDYLVGLFRSANPGQADAQRNQSMTAVQLLDRGVDQINELAAVSPEARLELLNVFAMANAGLGRFDVSLALRQRAVVEAEAQHGTGSLPALSHRVYLAQTLGLVGRLNEGLREIDVALSGLAREHPLSRMYAEALIGSASLRQTIDPSRALRDAELAVHWYEAAAARASSEGRQVDGNQQALYRGALLTLGLQQQTGGALRRSLATLTTTAELSARLVGADNLYSVNARTRRLYSLLALGYFQEVVREAPGLLEANAKFDAASATLVPQVRLYYARALSALGRHAEAEQQARTAIGERSHQPNPLISPRQDTFRGLLWVVQLGAQPRADAVRGLEAMLQAGEGVPSTRMQWATSLVQACLALGDRVCAERHAALASSIASGLAASQEMKLQQLIAAAQLADAATPQSVLDPLLLALQAAEAVAESDLDLARIVLARALALHHAGRSAEAIGTLRGREALFAGLQHAGLQAQFKALAASLGRPPPAVASRITSR